MRKSATIKKGVFTLFLVLTSACTSNPERFPLFAEQAKRHSRLPIIVDVFMTRDISGTSIGVNSQISEESLRATIEKSTEMLTDRGYQVELVRSFDGLGIDFVDDATYVVSENWRSTGQPYVPAIIEKNDGFWLTKRTSGFLQQLSNVAREISAKDGLDQAEVEDQLMQANSNGIAAVPMTLANYPLPDGLFDDISDDILVYVRVQGRYQQLGKFLAQGVLIGGISNALTGGLVVIPRGSFAITDVVAFDPKIRKIFWHARGYSEGRRSLLTSLKSALIHYPYIDGETHRQKKKRRKQELLKNYR